MGKTWGTPNWGPHWGTWWGTSISRLETGDSTKLDMDTFKMTYMTCIPKNVTYAMIKQMLSQFLFYLTFLRRHFVFLSTDRKPRRKGLFYRTQHNLHNLHNLHVTHTLTTIK